MVCDADGIKRKKRELMAILRKIEPFARMSDDELSRTLAPAFGFYRRSGTARIG